MGLKPNPHVERLARYLPFQGKALQLCQEYVRESPTTASVDTKAFSYVNKILDDPRTSLVVLTGDAGHGKTHICARILKERVSPSSDVSCLITTACDGKTDLAVLPGGRKLRIVKDLSDVTHGPAVDTLMAAIETTDIATIVCANEGKLRDTLQRGGVVFQRIRETLDQGLTHGTTTLDRSVYVVNLNFQAVTVDENSLVARLLRNWASDRRFWQTCTGCEAWSGCEALTVCPIYENHRALSDDRHGSTRIQGINELLRLIETSGRVITFRELLITLAFAITGGLRCADVHSHYRRSRNDRTWQYSHLYHQVLFDGAVAAHRRRKQSSLLSSLTMFDPGRVAVREVDDCLEPSVSDEVGRFLAPEPPASGYKIQARNAQQRQREAAKGLMTFLRRRDFFNLVAAPNVERGIRLGFRYASDFNAAIMSNSSCAGQTDALIPSRDRLLNGLEAIQGVRRPLLPQFLVIDPSFTYGSGRACVVSRSIVSRAVGLVSQSEWWERKGKAKTSDACVNAVDWADRRLYLVFGVRDEYDGSEISIPLDLLAFELVFRYSHGLNANSHFRTQIRRLSSQLARLTAEVHVEDHITVLVDGQRRELMIDVDGSIRMGNA